MSLHFPAAILTKGAPPVDCILADFQQFVQRHETAVFTFCYRMLGNTVMADCVAATAFQNVYAHFPTVSLVDVLVVARRYCRHQLQNGKLVEETAVADIQRLFNQLEVYEREAVALRYGCKLNFDEIARILGTTCEAVRATLQQGRWHIANLEQTRLASQN